MPVLILTTDSTSAYIPLIAGGLAFALIGDILLMLPESRFVLGIGSFAAMHALYLAAFISAAGLALVNPSTIPLLLFTVIMTRFLWPGLRKSLQIPVLAYVVLITIMTIQAIGAAVPVGGYRPSNRSGRGDPLSRFGLDVGHQSLSSTIPFSSSHGVIHILAGTMADRALHSIRSSNFLAVRCKTQPLD